MGNRKKYLIRALSFILKYAVIGLLIILIAVTVFFSVTHLSNIDIMVREGMKARAKVVYNQDESIDLTNYFTQNCLNADDELNNGRYEGYTITGYNQKTDFSMAWVWPWENEKVIYVTESMVNVKGSVTEKSENSEEKNEIPEWKNGIYRIVLIRDGSFWSISSRWVIAEMKFVQQVEPVPVPTPGASSTIYPQITPTPTLELPLVSPNPSAQ